MTKLIYSSTKDSDMLYALKKNIADPVFFLETENKKYVFLDQREYGVFKEERYTNIEPILLTPLLEKIKTITEEGDFREKLAYYICLEYGLLDKEIKIPMNFPIDILDYLRARRIRLKPVRILHPERKIKTKAEIKAIAKNQKNVLKAFREMEKILKEAEIKNDSLIYRKKILTSEILKKAIRKILVKNDLIDLDGLIVSSGFHSSIPHHSGAGKVKPNEPIVIDIFPKNLNDGYAADMTRTYVKGTASDELKNMHEAVLAAQEKAIALVRAGARTKDIYGTAKKELLDRGFHAGEQGFIHGLGHGLGLDIHEAPYLNALSEEILEPGNIITIEPGLYYPEIGGIRLEDVLLVTKNGYKNLTNYPKNLLIE